MSENPIAITNLNDFIFCPVSIYFHNLDYETERIMYQDSYQINGTAAHTAVDSGTYSDKSDVFQSMPVYSEKYNLYGKIDIFDNEKHLLTERKKKIITVYDGFIFQLFAQYFGLIEAGYDVKEIRLYSMDDNKIYPIELPENNAELFIKFEKLIENINHFSFADFVQYNIEKCKKCIYEPLCSFSALKR